MEKRGPGADHVTDRDCPLRRGHLLKRLRPRARPVRRGAGLRQDTMARLPGPVPLLCPGAVVLCTSRHLVEAVVWRLRTGPLRRSAAHVATMSAGVPAFSARRRRGRHAATCRPPGLDQLVTQEKATQTCLSRVVLVVLVLLVLLVLLLLVVLNCFVCCCALLCVVVCCWCCGGCGSDHVIQTRVSLHPS